MDSVILVGGGGHAKQIIEIITAQKSYHIAGITDNDPAKRKMQVAGVPIIGNDKILNTYFTKGIKRAFISLGSVDETGARISLYNMLKDIGFALINVVHSSVIISPSVTMGTGNALMPGSIINTHTTIGNNCIINTGTIVEHDCTIQDHVHIATGAKLAGGVTVQEGSHIGIGALIKQGVTIGRQVIVGAGALVLDDIPDRVVCAGMPAKVIKHLGNTTIH
jgi:UDP-perosamine 4-acetyltransferase